MKAEWIIPTDWSEVTVEQYMLFYNSVKVYDGLPDMEVKILERVAQHFCGISPKDWKRLPIDTYNDISQTLLSLLQKSKTVELTKSFELNGTKYGFIPDLEKMTYGEYIDLVTYTRQTWDNLGTILSILYRPITEERQSGRYRIEEYTGTDDYQVELFTKRVGMDIAFGATSFFLNGQKVLLKDILTSSMKEITKEMQTNTRLNQGLIKSGISTEHLSNWQEEFHTILDVQPQWMSEKH
jgi:hypothetical protein